MAITLVVEDGTGLANANTYATLAEANTYIAANIHANATWDNLDDDDKKYLLIWATRYIDQRTTWAGLPTTTTQALQWPRAGAYDRNGISVANNVLPLPVKDATCEMARYLMTDDRSVERSQDALKSVKVDVIEVDFLQGYKLTEVPNMVRLILKGLGAIASGNGGAVPIKKS